jgi:uncharacterized membrane protein YoaK (UPF0700 family)
VLRTHRIDPETIHLPLMLALTFSTGVADSVGYLGLDKVFTGNMTGNVVILAMALAGGKGLPIVGPLIALFAFMVGAAAGGRTLRRVASGWSSHITILLGTVAIVLIGVSVVLFSDGGRASQTLAYVVTALLAAAMGLQASVARHIAVKDVTTVVVTSTLTSLAADSWLGAAKGQPWARRAGAIVLIGAGAGVGALLLLINLGFGVALSGVITLVVAALGHSAGRAQLVTDDESRAEVDQNTKPS